MFHESLHIRGPVVICDRLDGQSRLDNHNRVTSLPRGHAPTSAWGFARSGVSACLLSRRGGAEVPPRQPAPGNTRQETRKRHMVVERWIARRGQRNSRVGSIRWRLVAPGSVLLCLATLALGTCDSPPDPQTTIRTDSAGIPITTALAPQWGTGEGWTISEEPLLEIGALDGPGEYLLDGVIGAVRLSNGDIVLGEWASGELRRYDRKGTFMWRAGGQGEGPGEHAFLTFVGFLPGDSVVTYDGALRRVQIFGPDGVVARTMSRGRYRGVLRPVGFPRRRCHHGHPAAG